ncbi:hypothetical protein A2U01_0031776, partial [Trifolium medium]|nr:hypothetical protein [Trifolium medium]
MGTPFEGEYWYR